MAIFCGMRRGELIALEWSDLDFTDNSVHVTKSTSLVNGKPETHRYNESCCREEDKLPAIPLQSLRHTSATLLISQNVDYRLSHAQTSTTMDIYSHALQKLDEEVAATLDTWSQKSIIFQTLVK